MNNILIIGTPEELGDAIRARRKAQGLTLAEAAMLFGVGPRFLSELENGKATAEVGKVLNVLNGLGLVVRLAPRGAKEAGL